jgi:hypothetical protein
MIAIIFPYSLDMYCPICGNMITISVKKEVERGEFGVILSENLIMDSNPNTIDRHNHCQCDFSKPLAEALADYLNDDDRIAEFLYPTDETGGPLDEGPARTEYKSDRI